MSKRKRFIKLVKIFSLTYKIERDFVKEKIPKRNGNNQNYPAMTQISSSQPHSTQKLPGTFKQYQFNWASNRAQMIGST